MTPDLDMSRSPASSPIDTDSRPNREARDRRTIPAGDVPATAAIAIHATDMLVHGCDLAVATGQDRGFDPDLCEAAIAIIGRFPASTWGNPKFYAERVPTDSAEPASRLVALTGRDPQHHLDGGR
jgi:uncharacterized protein (TIGR03086 family)